MDTTTQTALDLSIAKWEKLAQGEGEYPTRDNCPLCALFNSGDYDEKDSACIGCPVYAKTGERFCQGTPYENYVDDRIQGDTPETAAQEVEFLKSLRPKAEQPHPHKGDAKADLNAFMRITNAQITADDKHLELWQQQERASWPLHLWGEQLRNLWRLY